MKIWSNKPIEAGVFRGSALGIHLPPITSVFEAAMFIAQLAASQLMQNGPHNLISGSANPTFGHFCEYVATSLLHLNTRL